MTDLYDVVVVGAGVEGSATALAVLEKAQGCPVAVLEQVYGQTSGPIWSAS